MYAMHFKPLKHLPVVCDEGAHKHGDERAKVVDQHDVLATNLVRQRSHGNSG